MSHVEYIQIWYLTQLKHVTCLEHTHMIIDTVETCHISSKKNMIVLTQLKHVTCLVHKNMLIYTVETCHMFSTHAYDSWHSWSMLHV